MLREDFHMAADKNRIEVSCFQTEGLRNRHFAGRLAHVAQTRGTSMLIKIGVCCAAAALVLLIKLSGENKQDPISALENTVATDEDELDDQLGRLKFVELPGIIEVFSSENKSILSLEYASSELLDEDTLLKIISASEQSVLINIPCEVKSMGEDPLYGAYVVLDMGDDTELTVYGLNELSLEDGQPLSDGDQIGSISARMALYAMVKREGRPVDPLSYLRLDIEQ
jgi:hypothetical protein